MPRYLWRRRFGGRDIPDAKRLRELEAENRKLKKLLAETILDKEALRISLRENSKPAYTRPRFSVCPKRWQDESVPLIRLRGKPLPVAPRRQPDELSSPQKNRAPAATLTKSLLRYIGR